MSKKVKNILILSLLFLIFIFLSLKFKDFILLLLSLIFFSFLLLLIDKINKNFLLICFTTLITIFCIEVYLKIDFKYFFNQINLTTSKEEIENYNNFQFETNYLGSQLKKGIYQHYKKKGNEFIFHQNYEINNENFRFNKYIKNTNSKNYNVSFFGDSNTFGWGLNDTETLPYLFYEQYKNYNVFNYGIIGGSVNQTLQMIRKNNKYLGDLNILFASSYQLPRITCNRDYSINTPTFKLFDKKIVFDGYCIFSFLKLNFQVPRIIGSIINRSELIKIIKKANSKDFSTENVKLYSEILKEINQISLKNNKKIVILYYEFQSDADKEIQAYLTKNQISFINISVDDPKFFIKHDLHFSKLANEHFLNEINQFLIALNH